MPNILVQTTLCDGEGEWQIERFSSLVSLLRADGHHVVARNREPAENGADPVLSSLETSDFDELWLFAADRGDGLAPGDVRGILRFRERGGGLLTSRDHENIGLSLLNLGSVGLVNHFRTYNRQPRRHRVARFLNSLESSMHEEKYQRIVPLEPVHELLRTNRSSSGVIEYFPAADHETAISVPPYAPNARVIAVSGSGGVVNANLAIVIDDECHNGRRCGRAVATACLHQFADNPDGQTADGASEMFGDFARNAARWLAPVSS